MIHTEGAAWLMGAEATDGPGAGAGPKAGAGAGAPFAAGTVGL